MLDRLFEVHSDLMTSAPGTESITAQRTMVMPSASAVPSNDTTAETQVIGGRVRPPTAGPPAVRDNVAALAASESKRKRRRWWIIGIIAVLVAAAAVTGWYFGAGPGSKVTLPEDLAGLSVEQATERLEDLGLTVNPTTQETDDPVVPVGFVADTDPPIGSQVNPGSEVTILVSTGPRPIDLPAFSGMTEDDAVSAVKAAPFTLVDPVIHQFDATIAKGLVLEALGAGGESLMSGGQYGELQPITLIISAGPLPDVGGKSVEEATQILAGVNLTATAGKEDFSDFPAGTVAGIDPEPNADGVARVFREGDSVDLVISRGPDLVQVPDVIGDNIAAAKAELEGLGFVVEVDTDIQEIFWSFPPAKVDDQSPAGGEMAKRGSTVTISG